MSKPLPYTITDKSIVVMVEGNTYVIGSGDSRYPEACNAIRTGQFDTIPVLLNIKGRLISESNGGLYLLNGMLRCDKYEIPALLATRITKMFSEGYSIAPISAFLENLMENPSVSSREELYGFIEACNLPITADGHFLAYKMVSMDFKDIRTHTMDNSVGAVVEMDRARVNADRTQTCSSGLHFCSEAYLHSGYASEGSCRVVIVKINPRDVVSIPTDYNNSKGRACRYEIVDTIPWGTKITPLFTKEYSDVEDEPESEETDVCNETESYKSDRWEIYNVDGDFRVSYDNRADARYVCDDGEFIWDAKNLVCIKGRLPFPGWTPEYDNRVGAKLNAAIASEIRNRLDNEDYTTLSALAAEYGVSDRTIRRIRDNESWVEVA